MNGAVRPLIRPLTGSEIGAAKSDLAQLRIQVFAAFPYLYDGDIDYEADYLSEFMAAPDAVLVAAIDQGRIVGAATASPTLANADKLHVRLEEYGFDTATSFYFGESVLLPEYRGQGIGNAFFDFREAHAVSCGAKSAHFAAVIRPDDHPTRPPEYVPLDAFWRKRGYSPLPGLISTMAWKEHGEAGESPKQLQHWGAAIVTFTVAAAQYPIEALTDWAQYAAKLERWLQQAADHGARLAIFPEYGAMELASLDERTMGDLKGSMAFVSSLLPEIDRLHAGLAARFDLHILAASAPFARSDGSYVNRARLFTPAGAVGVQDKIIMTRFEREIWGVSAGGPLRLFETALGRIGVLICYDSEFPLHARALVEAGAQILLVPSCTDSLQGYWRVRIAAQARALEGQCYTVQSPLVGTAPWSPAVDVNRGAAGIFGPPDGVFPDDGIVELGQIDEGTWVFGQIDVQRVADLRGGGAVLNMRHWDEQPGAARLPLVDLVHLN